MSRDAPDSRIHLCLPGSAEGLRWHPLSGIEKPGSGTEPIHQEHVMCSRFRGSCPSDVKSAVHPESGFPISLSVFTAALCAPGEIQKNPAARGVTKTLPDADIRPSVEPGLPQAALTTARSYFTTTLENL